MSTGHFAKGRWVATSNGIGKSGGNVRINGTECLVIVFTDPSPLRRFIPTKHLNSDIVRPLSTAQEILEMLPSLATPNTKRAKSWRKAEPEIRRRFNSTDIKEWVGVLQALHPYTHGTYPAPSVHQLFERTLRRVAYEFALVADKRRHKKAVVALETLIIHTLNGDPRARQELEATFAIPQ